jgi:hypothetical protein
MPDFVGVIIVTSDGLPKPGGPHQIAFNNALHPSLNPPATYKTVKLTAPNSTINGHVTSFVNNPNCRAIVATGTKIGRQVLARRTAMGSSKPIVMALDDGYWTHNFDGSYAAALITGMSSGYTSVVQQRVDDMHNWFAAAGVAMQLAVAAGTPEYQEKEDEWQLVHDRLVTLGYAPAANDPPRIYMNYAPPASTTFAPDPGAAGANAYLVLGGAHAFIARSDIVKYANTQGVVLTSGHHSAIVDAALAASLGGVLVPGPNTFISYGPDISYLYARAAWHVNQIVVALTWNPPEEQPTPWTPHSFTHP